MINHNDKLKGFERHPSYPKEKVHKNPVLQESKAEFNIVNNIPLEKVKFFSPQFLRTQPKSLTVSE